MKPSINLKCLLHVNYTYKASLFHSFSLVKKDSYELFLLNSLPDCEVVPRSRQKSKRQQPIGNEMVTVP